MSDHPDDATDLCDFDPPEGTPTVLPAGWRTDEVRALARGIRADLKRGVPSEDLPFGMAALADALEDAGCDHLHILNHCHQCPAHTTDCWVIGLILPPDPLDELPEPQGPVQAAVDRWSVRATVISAGVIGVILLGLLVGALVQFVLRLG